VEFLSGSDAWGYAFGKAKGGDDKTRERQKAAAVGFALRGFRLRPSKKSGSGSSLYDRARAISIIAAHTPPEIVVVDTPPEKVPNLPHLPEGNLAFPQTIDNKDKTEGTEGTEGLTGVCQKSTLELDKPSVVWEEEDES
jgi:hypothetical protein